MVSVENKVSLDEDVDVANTVKKSYVDAVKNGQKEHGTHQHFYKPSVANKTTIHKDQDTYHSF